MGEFEVMGECEKDRAPQVDVTPPGHKNKNVARVGRPNLA